ncbi:MAG: transcriptional repressor [Desulfobulbaceae bacterium]|jgi:Fur family ferric uptake transcriptional regulator|nr:transcriptional repressor [Desulfobulbaceae bacterium]
MTFPKMRLTTQRQIILEELTKASSHPTASEVYDMVRKRLPRIGLGTIYRNLELMAESGMIQKLETGGTQKRFDATIGPHYHIRCAACGDLRDVHITLPPQLDTLAAEATGYHITGHNIEFSGYCQNCLEKPAKHDHGH